MMARFVPKLAFVLVVATLFLVPRLATTQSSPSGQCSVLLNQAIAQTGQTCGTTGSNSVCFGHGELVLASTQPIGLDAFDEPGEQLASNAVQSLQASPADLSLNAMGGAYFRVLTQGSAEVRLFLVGAQEVVNAGDHLESFNLFGVQANSQCGQEIGGALIVEGPTGGSALVNIFGTPVRLEPRTMIGLSQSRDAVLLFTLSRQAIINPDTPSAMAVPAGSVVTGQLVNGSLGFSKAVVPVETVPIGSEYQSRVYDSLAQGNDPQCDYGYFWNDVECVPICQQGLVYWQPEGCVSQCPADMGLVSNGVACVEPVPEENQPVDNPNNDPEQTNPVIQQEQQQGIERIIDTPGLVAARQPNGDVDIYTPDGCMVGSIWQSSMSEVHYAERYIVQRTEGCDGYYFDLWSLGYPACQLQLNMYGPNGEVVAQFERQPADPTCQESVLLDEEDKGGVNWNPPKNVSDEDNPEVINQVNNVVDIANSLGDNASNLFRNPSCLDANLTFNGGQAQFTPAPGCSA